MNLNDYVKYYTHCSQDLFIKNGFIRRIKCIHVLILFELYQWKKTVGNRNLYIFLTVLSLFVKLVQPLYNTQHIKNRMLLVRKTTVISLCNKERKLHKRYNQISMLKAIKGVEEKSKSVKYLCMIEFRSICARSCEKLRFNIN